MSREHTDEGRPFRVGLAGTGPWAAATHGPGLARADGVDLVGVWGRSLPKAQALGERLGVTAYEEFDALVEDVDAVAFALPPDVQVELATRAASRGRHLLLDKPVSTSSATAQRLLEVATAHGVASVVFFVDRFAPEVAPWLAETAARGGWRGASVRWLVSLGELEDPSPASPWRHAKGALWDLAPHCLSSLIAVLGPVTGLVAVPGRGDLAHLVLTHAGGATSTVTVSAFAPPAVDSHELLCWGEHGTSAMPERAAGAGRAVDALAAAAAQLRASAESGTPHEADLRLGVQVVRLLEEAERRLAAAR